MSTMSHRDRASYHLYIRFMFQFDEFIDSSSILPNDAEDENVKLVYLFLSIS